MLIAEILCETRGEALESRLGSRHRAVHSCSPLWFWAQQLSVNRPHLWSTQSRLDAIEQRRAQLDASVSQKAQAHAMWYT